MLTAGAFATPVWAEANADAASTTVSPRLATLSPAKEGQRFSGEWSMLLSGADYQEGVDSSLRTIFSLNSSFQYLFSQDLHLDADLGVGTSVGRAQTRYDRRYQDSLMDVHQLVLAASIFPHLRLEAGAVNQGDLGSGLLIRDVAFPGIRAVASGQAKDWQWQVAAEKAVPTSTSLNTERIGKEPLPMLSAATAQLTFQRDSRWHLDGLVTYFNFQDLPAKVAAESAVEGNTITGDFADNSSFVYRYQGIVAGFGGGVQLSSRSSLNAGLQRIQNQKADAGSDRGELAYAQFNYELASLSIQPRFEKFYNESDTSPAYYNDGAYGHNNRQGEAFGVDVVFKNLGFQISGRYVLADVIDVNPSQDRLHTFVLRLETLNETF